MGARYAPVDPTLPPPWRALIDGNTGNIYYWNRSTNVTQYDKPLSAPGDSVAPPPTVVSRPNSQGPQVCCPDFNSLADSVELVFGAKSIAGNSITLCCILLVSF